MKDWRAAILAVSMLGGCETRLPDPPPAGQNQELPIAPPGALGPRAASLDPPVPPAPTSEEEPGEPPGGELDEHEQELDSDAQPGPQSGSADSGVAL